MKDKIKIILPKPDWGSSLASVILDLEKMRGKKIFSEIPSHIFFQLKNIFQMLETLGSARIEGNNTTLAEYIEKIIENKTNQDESDFEIFNLEKAINFIEENTNFDTIINRAYISELHKIVTKNLIKEGSRNPGDLRKINVKISNSSHNPPETNILQDYFSEFIDFINSDFIEQNQLLAVALAHHRFAYIHPFDNGNGRMGRLLNYAFLIKLGFANKNFRIINPSCVFYSDREKYYEMLSKADSLEEKDLIAWCEYFLLGLKNETEKIDSLLDADYVRKEILIPAIKFAFERKTITKDEFDVLEILIQNEEMAIKSEDLIKIGLKTSSQKTRFMKNLKDKEIVLPTKDGGRIYTINFLNNYLLRGVIDILKEKGFVSDFLNK